MQYDITRPSLIIAGTWNPAIFTPPWLAHNIFNYPEGSNVDLTIVDTVGPHGNRSILFIDGIGIARDANRLEFFGKGNDDLDRIESFARKIVETLKHTPIGAVGYNYFFSVDDADDDLVDALKTNDNVHAEYKVKNQLFRTTLEVDKNVDLNLTITVSTAGITFDFNYHHSNFTPDQLIELLNGNQVRYREHASELLQNLYKLDDFELLAFPNDIDEGKENE